MATKDESIYELIDNPREIEDTLLGETGYLPHDAYDKVRSARYVLAKAKEVGPQEWDDIPITSAEPFFINQLDREIKQIRHTLKNLEKALEDRKIRVTTEMALSFQKAVKEVKPLLDADTPPPQMREGNLLPVASGDENPKRKALEMALQRAQKNAETRQRAQQETKKELLGYEDPEYGFLPYPDQPEEVV